MQQKSVVNINIAPTKNLWQEGEWFWASDQSEFTITARHDGIISFQIAVPKIDIHSQALPINVEIILNGKYKSSRTFHFFGSFRVQYSAQKNEKLRYRISCSSYIIPDEILHNQDDRKLSVILRNFTFTERPPSSPQNDIDINRIKYLVYSSHKTATQSIVASLKANFGEDSTYFCHRIDTPSLVMLFDQVVKTKMFIVDLQLLVDSIYASTNRKIQIISVYREPTSRLISSFFQIRGDDDIKLEGKSRPDSIIYKYRDQPEALSRHFNKIILSNLLEGYYESIDIIFHDLGILHKDVNYNPAEMVTKISHREYDLFLTRFDVLISKFKEVLSAICNGDIKICQANLSGEKWYVDIHRSFKAYYHLPKEVKEKIRKDKKPLHSIFYNDQETVKELCGINILSAQLSAIIKQAKNNNATDVHIDAIEKKCIISARVAGVLHSIRKLSIDQGIELIDNIKKELGINHNSQSPRTGFFQDISQPAKHYETHLIPFTPHDSVIVRLQSHRPAKSTWTDSPNIHKKIFIWQMGKVGSSSMMASLKPHTRPCDWPGITDSTTDQFQRHNNIIHTHSLGPIYYTLHHSDEEFIVISLVRDLLQRNISALFQSMADPAPGNPYFIATKDELKTWSYERTYKEIAKKLRQLNLSDKTINWYKGLFRSHFYYPDINRYNLDIGIVKFDKDLGMQEYKSRTPRIKFYIICLEKLNDLENKIGQELGIKAFKLIAKNLSGGKWYKELYAKFNLDYTLRQDEITHIYESDFMNYFYSQEQIDQFKSKWRQAK